MDQFLDKFLFLFHACFALFNIFGWIWKKTRKLNLFTLSLTLFSWLILGIWYGVGYCPLTEWHWRIRYNLGFYDMPSSYIKFLIDTITGLDWDQRVVDVGTGIVFSLAFIVSIMVNIFELRKRQIPDEN